MIMCIQNLVILCQFVLKILSKNQILTSIKGCNLVAYFRKTIIYNTNVDLVNDDVYTKFGLILSIRSQDIGKPEDQWSCKRSPDTWPSKAQNKQNLENIW